MPHKSLKKSLEVIVVLLQRIDGELQSAVTHVGKDACDALGMTLPITQSLARHVFRLE